MSASPSKVTVPPRPVLLYRGEVSIEGEVFETMRAEANPPPVAGEGDAWLAVLKDLRTTHLRKLIPWGLGRRALGLSRYGTVLQKRNGRNALFDALDEVLDLVVYLRCESEEDPEVNAILWRAYELANDIRAMVERRHRVAP